MRKYDSSLGEYGPKAHKMGVSKEAGGGKGDNKTNPVLKVDPKVTNRGNEAAHPRMRG